MLLPLSSQQGELRPSGEMPGPRVEGWSSPPRRGPQRFPLASESVPFTQKGHANQMERNRAAAVNPRASRAVPARHPGAGAPCLPQPPGSRLPGELPPTRSLSLAPEQSELCVQGWHRSLRPPRANIAQAPGTASPTAPADPAMGEWACALTPAQEGQYPMPPDPGRDPACSPEHTLAMAKSSGSRS